MISAGIPSPASGSATSIARPVLPVAVAPAMTRSGGAVSAAACLAARTGRRARRGRSTRRPTSSGPPARWTSLFWRSARRPSPLGGPCSPPVVVVVVRPRRRHARRRGPRPRGPTQARLRSSPIASWSASSSFRRRRLTSGGTSSARCVAGVPGRSRVRGGEDLVVADGLEEPERRLELGLGLAAEPDDHVGRDRDPGHRLADPGEPLEVVLDRVLAAHPLEHRVVAGLDRQVEVLADRRALGHRRDQPIARGPTGATSRTAGAGSRARRRRSGSRRSPGSARRGRAGRGGRAGGPPSGRCRRRRSAAPPAGRGRTS